MADKTLKINGRASRLSLLVPPHFGFYWLRVMSPKWDLNLNSLLVKRQIDNPSPGAVTGGN